MNITLTTNPVIVTTEKAVRFYVTKNIDLKNINQITLKLDQEGLSQPSSVSFDLFGSEKVTGLICGLENNKFYFELDFSKVQSTFKYHFGNPIKAIITIKNNSGEIFEQTLPDVILKR